MVAAGDEDEQLICWSFKTCMTFKTPTRIAWGGVKKKDYFSLLLDLFSTFDFVLTQKTPQGQTECSLRRAKQIKSDANMTLTSSWNSWLSYYKTVKFLKNLWWNMKWEKHQKRNITVSFHQGGAASCFLSSYNTVTLLSLLFLFPFWHLSISYYPKEKQEKKITAPKQLSTAPQGGSRWFSKMEAGLKGQKKDWRSLECFYYTRLVCWFLLFVSHWYWEMHFTLLDIFSFLRPWSFTVTVFCFSLSCRARCKVFLGCSCVFFFSQGIKGLCKFAFI